MVYVYTQFEWYRGFITTRLKEISLGRVFYFYNLSLKNKEVIKMQEEKLQEKQEMGVDILRGTCYNKQA